MIQKKNSSNRR